MPIQPQRTRSLVRIKRKLPTGKLVTHYQKRRPAPAKCALCKKPLLAVPRETQIKFRNIPKSLKRPERPYGGFLCSACARQKMIEKTPNVKYEKIEPGRLVVKTAGREAGKIAVIIEKINNNFVLVDGQVKRRACNISHLATLDKIINVTNSSTKAEIEKELEKLGYTTSSAKSVKVKAETAKEKPKRQRTLKKQEKPKVKKENPEKKISKKQSKNN